ncbi:2-C-methyl-D-erythritol 4-phosphate cytidylyltransferase [Pararobbsia silviterrae]|uniref:2-C-methyl-D-erythritol 4-phosphate cytidylyltransferase n=1 Tax=Pararobbsia silviterrae TaxID=1792498 RepID=A0A494XVS3_9BURK|nr:2-C-methyl-D-erythritol 4-phosphate cytidylyltransferase [Pararobbsia silviterrae]RKP54721.1 2-C-methyl-D-erythritol 4-phosphate cytidylyltransferase [Pararobbsia silviterrae]
MQGIHDAAHRIKRNIIEFAPSPDSSFFRVNARQNDRLFALIPCAGVGARAGANMPKQYRAIGDRALLHYTLAAFDACDELAQTLVVLSPDDALFDAAQFSGLRFTSRRCGGATRHESVLNGLGALAELGAADHDWVLVHDAARPGVTPALIRQLVEAVRDDEVGGIIAMPLADTLKRAAHDLESARIGRTEPRDGLWLAQTPQMFRIGLLRHALVEAQQAGFAVTDEASALERLGHRPRLVTGTMRNFKVTYPEDFAMAEAILLGRAI